MFVIKFRSLQSFLERRGIWVVGVILVIVSALAFMHYYQNGLGLAYNDARSHLNIGRRVVEGLKPGVAQLGSVWLPLPHVLMIPTIWNDFMWHSGLAGAIVSMISFVGTGVLVYLYLARINVSVWWRFLAVAVFATNVNILYLQSTAMTELLLLFTTMAACYAMLRWSEKQGLFHLIVGAFFIMLSTVVRYDGWFLLVFGGLFVAAYGWKRWNFKTAEGLFILFGSLAGLGIVLWLLWNQLIFNDALYFAFGPFSAHSQQDQLEAAGVLPTKGNMLLSVKIYLYAMFYNSDVFVALLGLGGVALLWFDKKIKTGVKFAAMLLLVPIVFNITALYLGHSVLYIQGISGTTWFNVRYGIMLMPALAIFVGYLAQRLPKMRGVLIGLLVFVTFFALSSHDAVTIDDARVGSSQKNVSEVSGYLHEHAANTTGFILISAASHDAIIFSSGLPMKRFIHEGTGAYWTTATEIPDQWARWIVMRTHDDNDLTYKMVKDAPGLERYHLVAQYPFADVYELNSEYLGDLHTTASLGVQR